MLNDQFLVARSTDDLDDICFWGGCSSDPSATLSTYDLSGNPVGSQVLADNEINGVDAGPGGSVLVALARNGVAKYTAALEPVWAIDRTSQPQLGNCQTVLGIRSVSSGGAWLECRNMAVAIGPDGTL